LLAGAVATAALGSVRQGTIVDRGGRTPPTALTAGPMGAETAGDNLPFRISPDSQYVVQKGASGLFSRRLPDGPWTQLAPPSICWDGSDEWLITDDSQTVLFTCPASTLAPKDLWAVPIAGPASAAVLLSVPPDDPVGVNNFYSATAGSRVFYRMNRLEPERTDLYSVPVAGPASEGVVINGALGEFGGASGPVPLQLSPRVVYSQWHPSPQGGEIWLTDRAASNSVPIGISPPSHPLGGEFQVAPDEQTVVWRAGDANFHFWIYSAPVSDPPGAAIQLNPDLPAASHASVQAISPDSARVVYRANPVDLARYDLFSVPIGGPSSSAVNLSASVQNWDPIVVVPQFSPDSAWVLYLASREDPNRHELYRVPAAGPASANLRLNPIEGTPLRVYNFDLVPGTTDVVFALVVGASPDEMGRCHRGSWLGSEGNSTPLWTELLPPWGYRCYWVAESRGVLTIAIEPGSSFRTVWLAHGDGPLDPRPKKLLDESQFEPDGSPFLDPWRLQKTPDGKYVVYLATPLGGKEGVWVLPLPFFWDGFESAGTGHWSAAAP
jgi:hypothetical protein